MLARKDTELSKLVKCVCRCFNRDFAAQKAALEGKVTIIASHVFLFSCGVAHSHANAVSFHLQDETVKPFLQAVAFVCLTIVFLIYISDKRVQALPG